MGAPEHAFSLACVLFLSCSTFILYPFPTPHCIFTPHFSCALAFAPPHPLPSQQLALTPARCCS